MIGEVESQTTKNSVYPVRKKFGVRLGRAAASTPASTCNRAAPRPRHKRSTRSPIRLDLLAHDAICAAEARGANAGTLDQTTDLAAINTDIRQIKVLLKQAGNAIDKAVDDGDMTAEKASTPGDLLAQSAAKLTPASLELAVTDIAAGCRMFD